MQKIFSLSLAAIFSTIFAASTMASCPATFESCPKTEEAKKD